MTTVPLRYWPYPGSGWWRFDFHTHTPASSDYGKGPNQVQLQATTPEQWLLGYMRAGIDCVAVTDHNSSAWIDRLKAALAKLEADQHADFRPLHLFPGVEITANGGVHVLALFDPQANAGNVSKLLGAAKYHGTQSASDTTADTSVIEVVTEIAGCGAIPILAHVDGPSGAFGMSGNTLAPLLECPDLFAIEVCDTQVPKPDIYAQRKLAWAQVLGSDAHHPSGKPGNRYPGSHFTWVKMEQPTLDSLRLALLDGDGVSIRRSDDTAKFSPFGTPEHFIEFVEIKQARYMGRGQQPARFNFSPWFNALIGGRGTGKSTVVHFLRLAYHRGDELAQLGVEDSAARTFNAFVHTPKNRDDSGGLNRDGKSTQARVTLMRDGVRYRLTWHQEGTISVEEQSNGNWAFAQNQEVTPERFPIRMFSQGQIASLATERSRSLLRLIDQAMDASTFKTAISEEEDGYLKLRASERELTGRLGARGALSVQLDDVSRKLARFEKEHHADVLKNYQRKTRQEREIKHQFDAVEKVAAQLQSAAAEILPEDLPKGLFDSPNAGDALAVATVQRLHQQLQQIASDLTTKVQALRATAASEQQVLAGTQWEVELKAAKSRYTDLVAALKSQGVDDPSEYGKLVQDRQQLEGELTNLDALEKHRTSLSAQAGKSLARLTEKRRALTAAREQFLASTLEHNAYVKISLEAYGRDARALRSSFRAVIDVSDDRFEDDILVMDNDVPKSGVVTTLLAKLPKAGVGAEFESRLGEVKKQLAETCRGADESTFGGHFRNYLKKRFTDRPEFLDRLMVWFPEDTLHVEYSPKGDGKNFTAIVQASAGQRAAAILAFLLAHGNEPIVLDQPEDDLDNHLIYSLVVQQIRANKHTRQIIVVTHNPNIVVNGDAEMNHAMDFRNGQCQVTERGSLQTKAMREEVCKVMEGGREAFEKRYRRLGRS